MTSLVILLLLQVACGIWIGVLHNKDKKQREHILFLNRELDRAYKVNDEALGVTTQVVTQHDSTQSVVSIKPIMGLPTASPQPTLSDETIAIIHCGLVIPNERTVQEMAREIRMWRGEKYPEAV